MNFIVPSARVERRTPFTECRFGNIPHSGEVRA
jgi:hypothetical protein